MTHQLSSKQPPRLAFWALNLFTPVEQAESILGDLHEEFLQVGSKSGGDVARNWYWRQSLRTIAHLVGGGFRGARCSTAATVIAGFLLLRFAHGLPDKLLTVVTDKYLMYWSNHFQAYLWVLRVLPLEYLMGSLFTGCVVGLAAKGREMIATMTLALILCAMSAAAAVWLAAHTGDASFFWNLPWFFSDPAAIVMGGVIARKLRSSAATRVSA
jgi:hypothetical protein